MNKIKFVFADPSEEKEIKRLLAGCGLPYTDIKHHLPHFIVAKGKKKIIGVVGLEVYGKTALLRSMAVIKFQQGKGIGKLLYSKILAYAHLKGIKKLYLLTTTAKDFFLKFGFKKVGRTDVTKVIKDTKQFRELCPSTAICMVKDIEKGIQYFPKELLILKNDLPGVAMWGICLDKAMMTCFEIDPHKRFERHTHKSEQITAVMDGELFFETGEGIICVKKGEVIAIPSNIPHAAFTKDSAVKAIDAWSPVMDKYKGDKR